MIFATPTATTIKRYGIEKGGRDNCGLDSAKQRLLGALKKKGNIILKLHITAWFRSQFETY